MMSTVMLLNTTDMSEVAMGITEAHYPYPCTLISETVYL